MDWLNETLDKYENQQEDKAKKTAEEKKRIENEIAENRKEATEILGNIYKYFLTIKKELRKRKYPCEAELEGARDVQTNEQINSSASLIIDRNPVVQKNKLSSGIDPALSFIHDRRSDNFTIKQRLSGSSEFETKTVKSSTLTAEYVTEITEQFVKSFFSTKDKA